MVGHFVATALLGLGVRAVHPLHTTLTTIDRRTGERTIQVAVRVFTTDLAEALARWGGGRAEPGSDQDAATCDYARRSLTLRDATDRPLDGRRCRIERAVDVTWIRFEAPAPERDGIRIRSAFLFELFTDQINIVQVRTGGRPQTLLFTRGDGFKPA